MRPATPPNCPSCATVANVAFVAKDYNRRTTAESFNYCRCPKCALVFLHPIPLDLGRYYPTEYFPMPSSVERLAQEASQEQYKIELLRHYAVAGRVLDIGAGYGHFVYLAHAAGYEIDAIEMNQGCCDYIARVIGTQVIAHTQPAKALVDLAPYDVITLWHVFEHLTDAWAVLQAAAQNLHDGGWLVIAMPNPQSFQFRVFGRYWAHLDAPRHVQLVPMSRLIEAATGNGQMRFIEATTTDQGGLAYNQLGWTWSMRNALPLRGMWRIGSLLSHIFRRFEQVGMRGSCYTVVFRKMQQA